MGKQPPESWRVRETGDRAVWWEPILTAGRGDGGVGFVHPGQDMRFPKIVGLSKLNPKPSPDGGGSDWPESAPDDRKTRTARKV